MWPFSNKKNSSEDEIFNQSSASDIAISKELQDIHPWLIRVSVEDTKFALILNHVAIAIPKDRYYTGEPLSKIEDLIALIKNLKLYCPDKSSNASRYLIYASFILWFHNICLLNKSLYLNIMSLCFNKSNMLETKEEREKYICARLIDLELYDIQIDDIYFILKGYFDAMYMIGDKATSIIVSHFNDRNDFISYLSSNFDDTKHITQALNANEVSELFTRDFLIGANLNFPEE